MDKFKGMESRLSGVGWREGRVTAERSYCVQIFIWGDDKVLEEDGGGCTAL